MSQIKNLTKVSLIIVNESQQNLYIFSIYIILPYSPRRIFFSTQKEEKRLFIFSIHFTHIAKRVF